ALHRAHHSQRPLRQPHRSRQVRVPAAVAASGLPAPGRQLSAHDADSAGSADPARADRRGSNGGSGGRPRIMSAAFSAMAIVGALVLPLTTAGITDASTT